MNQARKRTGTKKVLSMILVLVMLLSLLSMAAFTLPTAASSDSAASNADFMRIFHLDCGRKYFSVSEIKGIIDQLAANHYTHLQLAFGNNGFRFLLDEMPVGSYTSEQVKNALTNGNRTYSNSNNADSSMLSESDMDAIIAYAEKNGISIIPMLNTPGHMDALVSAMSELNVGSSRTTSEMRLTDDAQVNFVKALQQKYINYFADHGSKYYNFAADEYTFSALSDSEYTAFATYVNAIAKMVKDAGMTPMCYNDGINYSGKTSSVAFDTDILVCYWAQDVNYASVTELSNAGFKIINNNDAWYYVLGDYLNIWANPQWRYEDALEGIQNTPVTQAKNVADKEVPVVGSVLCVWCDGPAKVYSNYETQVYNLIKAMADANPAYFTDAVKLPATDTDDQVSVVVTGTKGQTATVDAVSVRSTYQFDAEKVVSYNVTPMVAGQNYTARGTVTLPVPTGWVQDASRIRAYIIDNGAVKLLSGTLADGKYTFDVPHFSEMGLLQIAENGDSTVSVSVNQGSTSSSYTLSGDNLPNDGTYTTTDGLASYTVTTGTGETVAEKAGTIVSGNTYIIGNGTQYIKLDGTSITSTTNPAEATQWTLTASSDGYYITSGEYYLSYRTNGSVMASSYYNTAWKWNTSANAFNDDDWWTSYYLTYDNGWKVSKSKSGVSSQAYTTRALPGEKTVTFTGVQTGTTAVTLGDKTYNITVTEKQTVEIPISIVDYRADGLLFDFQVGGATYDYGLVHSYNNDGSKSGVNGGTLSGTSYGTRIAGTTLENTGYVASDGYSGNYYLWGNKWSRSGMVESALGSNGMPVYTNATVARVAQELAKGNYNSGEMANVTNSNKVIYDTFIASGKVVNSEASKMSDAFSAHKSWDNITNAYDLAWYLLNTLYQADNNTTTVTDANGVSHTVPIYGMAVNAYDSIILTENNGVYSFDAANGKSHYDTNSRSIYEDDSVTAKQFYPVDGLGYDAILGDTTDKANDSGSNRPEHPNGNYALRGEAQFVYRDDLYFEFSGDDDVYMYINGVLALDLGGAHGICTRRVNLKDVAQQCHLTEGEVATFTFFYMERNSDASNFKIETNMELVKRGISVQKNAYDAGYANEIMSGTAVETGRSVYYDLVVTNQSNALMNHICFNDTDDRGGTASFGFGVANAGVTAGTNSTDGTVSLGAAGTYEIYVTDANNAEVAGTRRTFGSLSELSAAVAAVELQPGQSLHVRFLTATFAVKESKILNYVNTVRVSAAVGSQQLSDEATNELYSYNANDTSKTYVVDFGLPLQITGIFDSGAENNIGNVKLNDSNTLKYGTVVLTPDGYNSSLVYTRTDDKAINDAETIVLDVTYKMGSSNITLQKTLTIIPATSVYYEDSFAQFTDGTGKAADATWSIVGNNGSVTEDQSTSKNQALTELGKMSADAVYGHDAAYADSTKLSMGSARKVTVKSDMYEKNDTTTTWPTATFTFKGTGFDVISLTDNNSGMISVKVYAVGSDGTETLEKAKYVNNYYGYECKDGVWTVNNSANNALYQIPVIKVDDLAYGTHKVVITTAYASYADKTGDNQYSFWLDAIRVYDPMGKDNDTYKQDNEGYPQYIKLRDQLAKENGFVTTNTNLLFIDGAEKAEIATYANYGPNNEVYLANGQAITFTVPKNAKIASIQIGAKAPNGSAAKMVVNGTETNITSATEMYYEIGTEGRNFTIANNGNGVLSLTNLKITFTDKPGSTIALTAPTADEQTAAVMSVRALFAAPEQTFEPEHFTAKWSRNVRKGGTATLTVKASADVEAITVNGEEITAYTTKTARSFWGSKETYHVFTYRETNAATADYSVCALNADGVASDPITATLTVRPSIRDWWNGIFDKWKH
jgi:fibro-slime domain-containing protein